MTRVAAPAPAAARARGTVALTGLVKRYGATLALDGVSLTIASVSATAFEVALIPETLARTTLGAAGAGDRVNVEVDLLARYLDRLLRAGSRR